MENNKPEWLRKAEEEQAKFNETKWAKMTDAQLAQSNVAIEAFKLNDSEEQRKRYLIALEKHPNMQSNGGKTSGKNHVESGFLKSICGLGGKVTGPKLGKSNAEKISTCEHCGHTDKYMGMIRHHFDNCHSLLYSKFLNLLPDTDITFDIAEQVVVGLGLSKRNTSKFLEATCEFQKLVKFRGEKTRWKKCTWKKRN